MGLGPVKVYKAFIRLVSGGILRPPYVYVRRVLCPFNK